MPDASRYVDFAWSPFQDFNSEHINHFSLVSLANLLRQCGLRPLHAGGEGDPVGSGDAVPAIYAFAQVDASVPATLEKDVALKERLVATCAFRRTS